MFSKHALGRASVAMATFVLLVCSAFSVYGQVEKKPAGVEKAMMRFLVISPHTDAECLATLDGVLDQGAPALAKYDWGCKAGDHKGYFIVEAKSADEALKSVPALVRSKAKAIELNKFTAEQIRQFHASAKVDHEQ